MIGEFFKKNTTPFVVGCVVAALALWPIFNDMYSNRLENLKSDNAKLLDENSRLKEGKTVDRNELMHEINQFIRDAHLLPNGMERVGSVGWGSSDISAQYGKALNLGANKQYEVAILSLDSIIKKHRFYPYPHFHKALFFYGMGNEIEAEESLKKFLEKLSFIEKSILDKSESYMYRSKALYLLAKKEESKVFLENAIKMKPKILDTKSFLPGLFGDYLPLTPAGKEWLQLVETTRTRIRN